MSNAWDKARESAKEASSGGGAGLFVRLPESGSKVVGVFLGDPEQRKVVWIDGKSSVYSPTNHKGEKAKTRWLMNFFDLEQEDLKIFEMSNQTFENLLEIRDKYEDKYGFENCSFEIKRSGTGLETKYSILFEDKLDKKARKQLPLDTHDLIPYCIPEAPAGAKASDDDAIIF